MRVQRDPPRRRGGVWRRWTVAATLLAVATLPFAGCGVEGGAVRVERSVYLMGTTARFVAEAPDRAAGLERLELMVRVVEDVEAALSTWRRDSELGRLNRREPGSALPLSEVACTALARAERWWRETDGAFDPVIGRLIEAWGLREGGRRPDSAALAAARDRSGFGGLRIDAGHLNPPRGAADNCSAARVADVTLDAGAFGKGAALDEVRRTMRGAGASGSPHGWMVDFGGQLAVHKLDWPMAIAHPQRRGEPAVALLLREGSIATSGGSERDLVLDDGVTIGHIIDPRTGMPVARRGSVSVWSASALDADALSTALQVMGAGEGFAWAEERDVAACFLLVVGMGGGGDGDDGVVGVRVRALATVAFSRRFGEGCARGAEAAELHGKHTSSIPSLGSQSRHPNRSSPR